MSLYRLVLCWHKVLMVKVGVGPLMCSLKMCFTRGEFLSLLLTSPKCSKALECSDLPDCPVYWAKGLLLPPTNLAWDI